MRKAGWMAMGAALALFAGGCGDDDDDGGGGSPGPQADVSFSTEVHPILVEKCGTCHFSEATGEWGDEDVAKSYAAALEQVDLTTPAESPLLVKGNGDGVAHPDQLSDGETQTIRTWIEQGARDN